MVNRIRLAQISAAILLSLTSAISFAQTCPGSLPTGMDCVGPGLNKDITAFTICTNVVNGHSSGLPLMVPMKTSTEWSEFRAKPPAGVTFVACAAAPVAETKRIVLTSTALSTWTVPADWSSTANTIEAIGGGGGSFSSVTSSTTHAGGGAAYAKETNVVLSAGANVTYQVGAAGTGGATTTDGGDTIFGSYVVAAGGKRGTSSSYGAGGLAANSTGSLKYDGGRGGSAGTSGGGGGGAAAGPHGVGARGGNAGSSGSGGGGGANGGAAGANAITGTNAVGGTNRSGTGAGTSGGGAGSNGGGGGGGTNGGQGSVDVEWVVDSVNYGPGGGGGGGSSNGGSVAATGYGGAGGAGANSAGASRPGLIVITYNTGGCLMDWGDLTAPTPPMLSASGNLVTFCGTAPQLYITRGLGAVMEGLEYQKNGGAFAQLNSNLTLSIAPGDTIRFRVTHTCTSLVSWGTATIRENNASGAILDTFKWPAIDATSCI